MIAYGFWCQTKAPVSNHRGGANGIIVMNRIIYVVGFVVVVVLIMSFVGLR